MSKHSIGLVHVLNFWPFDPWSFLRDRFIMNSRISRECVSRQSPTFCHMIIWGHVTPNHGQSSVCLGKSFVIHPILTWDQLDGISSDYIVSLSLIRDVSWGCWNSKRVEICDDELSAPIIHQTVNSILDLWSGEGVSEHPMLSVLWQSVVTLGTRKAANIKWAASETFAISIWLFGIQMHAKIVKQTHVVTS